MVGVTRKTASQFLTEFEREGWIELGRNRMKVLNRPALAAALQGDEQAKPPSLVET
jgi:hypothetical protein